jgi:hypothetical protein
MNGYKVIRKSSAVVFACDKCDHRIELVKFGLGARPSARTLGAAEMNAHIKKAHPTTIVTEKLDIFVR